MAKKQRREQQTGRPERGTKRLGAQAKPKPGAANETSAADPPRVLEPPSIGSSGRRIQILILEDNAADAELLQRELRKAGLDFTMQWARDKGAFLQALDTSVPDLVLTDYCVPGFDGLAALAQARQRFAEVPVVMVSGVVGEEVAIETLKAGATDYVLKQRLSRLGPVVRRALRGAEEIARRKQAQRALQEAHERLQAQAEELTAANEELRATEQALHRLNDELEQRVAARTAELSRAHAYTRSLIEASLDPLVTIGPDGKITDVNAATEVVTGCPRGELVGSDFCDYFTAPAKARAGYQRVFREGFVRDYPLEIRHKEGCVTAVLYNATVYRDEAGEVAGVFAAARDVTALRRAERAVHAERQRFNDVLETLPAYLVLLTPDYHVPFANRFFRERFGESHGQRCFEYLFGRTEPCEVCETYKVLKTNAPLRWEWTGPDGRHYDIYDFPFTDTDGSPLIMEMGIEITERKRAEAALQEANETLEQRVAERTAALQEANELLQTQTEELRTQGEELQAQAEELAAQAEELRQANEALRTSEERLAYLASFPERNPNPVMEVDLDGNIRYANAATLRLFPDLRKRGPDHLWLADWATAVQLFQDGQTSASVRDLTVGDRTYQQALYYFAQDRFVRIYAFDITARKLAEQRLTQEHREITLANRILQVFLEETGDDLFDRALQIVLEGMESRHGVFGYIDENGDLVCPSMSKLLAECEVADPCVRYPPGQWRGLWSRALRKKETLFTNEPPVVPQGHVPIRNNLAAPILFQGRAIGLLNLANKETGYAEADAERVAAVADRIAPVLFAWIQKELRENERQQAEAVLRESEKNFRTIFESNTDGILIVDVQSRKFLMGNQAICRMLGYQPEEIAHMQVADIHRREDLPLVLGHFERLARGKGGTGQSVPMRRRDGSVFFADITANPIILSGQTCLVGSFRDITEREQAEAALRQAHEDLQAQSEELTVANEELRVQSVQLQESEQRLRLALEGGKMGRWEWDLTTDSMFWCPRTYELLGLDPFRKAGVDTFLDCIHPDDRQAAKEFVADIMNEAEDFQAEFRILRHRAEPHSAISWLALHAQVIRDEQGRAVRTIGVLYDITARKQMEAELRQLTGRLEQEVQAQTQELQSTVDRLQDEVARRVLAEGRLRRNSRMLEAFFEHTITPLAFLDRQLRLVRVNAAFAKAEGRPPEFFVHKNYFELHPSEEDRVLFEQVLQTRRPYRAFAKPCVHLDKSQQGTRYWNWRITPLLDDAGQVQFLVFNLEDVTEQQKAFGELKHRAGLLQKLTLELSQAEDRERRRLAEVLHDDLQQVLAAAKFHLGLLHQRVKGDPPAKELADQLGRMLREAIEKSRGLSHELSPAVLYQSDLGETCEWLARQVQAKHGLTVHTEVHGRVDSASEPLKAFLFRAAQEILFNAVKHAQVPEARLRLQRRRGRLWLTIADRGRGFDPQTLGKTTGFGLFSIRERVELLGGRMKIHSVKGRGSVFLVAVPDETAGRGTDDRKPKAPDRGPKTEDELPASVVRPPASGARLRILLVDDHKTIRAGLAALIGEQPDMEVVGQADDGHKAIELARELGPDVVIVDVAMPMMPGDEAARRIKTLLPQTRIVALSMFEEAGVAQRMLDAGAEVYLAKTGPSEDLLAAIRGKA